VTQTIGGKARIRQRPGPNNALGRIKIDMPNDHAIYLHDTPARWAFGKPQRALSHGCIRVQGIERLAAEIAGPDKVQKALSTQATRTITLGSEIPVYLAYFTVEANGDGDLVTHPDPYDRDSELAASLDAHRSGSRIASR
jgi:murein L,D-transpeptidase YcbB/YkuD